MELGVILIAGPVVGYLIGRRKGHPALGAVLGFFFHLFGWIAMALIPRTPSAEALHVQHEGAKVTHAQAA